MNFIFNNPVKVYFGKGQCENLGKELAQYGKKVLLVYGGGSIKRNGLYDTIVDQCNKYELEIVDFPGVEPNPRCETVTRGANLCKELGIDVVLAAGGGSTIDCAKMIALCAKSEVEPWDYIVKKIPATDALPLVDILTLAATGTEMNPTAVLSNVQENKKTSYTSDWIYPKASFLDPTLMYSLPAYQTACGAADIFSHTMETYFSNTNMSLLNAEMEGIMKTVVKWAPVALREPDNYDARANLMWASSWAINGFVRSTQDCTWSCHSIEHQLSAVYDITHGLGLAIITPKWMKYVLKEENAWKFAEFGRNVFGLTGETDMEVALKSIEAMEDFLYNQLGLNKTLTEINIDDTHFEMMSVNACKGSAIKGYQVLTPSDVLEIYKMCL